MDPLDLYVDEDGLLDDVDGNGIGVDTLVLDSIHVHGRKQHQPMDEDNKEYAEDIEEEEDVTESYTRESRSIHWEDHEYDDVECETEYGSSFIADRSRSNSLRTKLTTQLNAQRSILRPYHVKDNDALIQTFHHDEAEDDDDEKTDSAHNSNNDHGIESKQRNLNEQDYSEEKRSLPNGQLSSTISPQNLNGRYLRTTAAPIVPHSSAPNSTSIFSSYKRPTFLNDDEVVSVMSDHEDISPVPTPNRRLRHDLSTVSPASTIGSRSIHRRSNSFGNSLAPDSRSMQSNHGATPSHAQPDMFSPSKYFGARSAHIPFGSLEPQDHISTPLSGKLSSVMSPIPFTHNDFISPIPKATNSRMNNLSFTPSSHINPFSPESTTNLSAQKSRSLPSSRHSSRPSSASNTPKLEESHESTRRSLQFNSPFTSPIKSSNISFQESPNYTQPPRRTSTSSPVQRTPTTTKVSSTHSTPSTIQSWSTEVDPPTCQIRTSTSLKKVHRFVHFNISSTIGADAFTNTLTRYLQKLSMVCAPEFHSCAVRQTAAAIDDHNSEMNSKGFTLVMIFPLRVARMEELSWPHWARLFEEVYSRILCLPHPTFSELRPS